MNRLIWVQAFVMCVAMGSLAWLYLHFLTCKIRLKLGKLFINIVVVSTTSSPKYYPGPSLAVFSPMLLATGLQLNCTVYFCPWAPHTLHPLCSLSQCSPSPSGRLASS